jgi:hypothetical protein
MMVSADKCLHLVKEYVHTSRRAVAITAQNASLHPLAYHTHDKLTSFSDESWIGYFLLLCFHVFFGSSLIMREYNSVT